MYVNLHTHSDYSLLDGLAKVDQLVKRAVELGMPALALTDHGVLYGAVDLYKKAKAAGIKPIIGVEAYIAPRGRLDKVPKIDSKYFHLTLLARNNQGYSNLIELVTAGWMEGFYYRPRLDRELLAQKAEGLIILTGCIGGEVGQAILNNKIDEAEKIIEWYQEIVGKEHVFIEIQDHKSLPDQVTVTNALIAMARRRQWPLVATCDSHYAKIEDKDVHEVLLAVQSKSADEDKRWSLKEIDLHLRTPEEMAVAFADTPDALANTLKVADLCDVTMTFGENKLPDFPSTRGIPNYEELRLLCEEGLPRRYGDGITDEHRQRLEYELSVIERMGFASYFLIVADYVNWAKNNGILVGPGRGSAAGSIVSYLIGITELDPVHYKLLFERFLNPDRIEMPDIDIDFADTDRAKVLQYVREKYGDDHVAGIITFGTMAARAAVRDAGRAIGMSYGDVDRVAKVIPPPKQGMHVPLTRLISETPELRQMYDSEPATKNLLEIAAKLEGTFRHSGQHASAFVISRDPLTKTVPLQPAQKGDVAHVTQFSMKPVDELGLLKMDFLGLSNLSIMQRAVEIIEAAYKQTVDVNTLPLDDAKTFELLAKAETTGVFQLESAGMKRYLRELKPDKFEHIIAMVALYRPGPLQFADSYIRRKNGLEPVSYVHPLVENALKSTFGIMLYQEEVMQLAKDMSGFTGGQADTLRKAIGKKIPKLMAEMRTLFIEGAVKNGVDQQLAEDLFTQIEEFAAYSFNLAHSACYAYIAYQTAYLKTHYPSAFMAALMTNDHGDTERLTIDIEECRRMGIEVLSPDVNESFVDFGVVPQTGNVRYGLAGIKNIGEAVCRAIVKERKAGGAYTSLLQFVNRLGPEVINKKVLENLAKAGALDQFAERNQILASIDQIIKIMTAQKKSAASNQIGLFDVGGPVAQVETTLDLPVVEPADQRQRLSWEKELLGMFLSEHPLKSVEELMAAHATPLSSLTLNDVGKTVRVAGILATMKKIVTKNNATMIFGMLEDLTTSREVVFFPRTLEQYTDLLVVDNLVLIAGRLTARDGELKITAEHVWPLNEALNSMDLSALDMSRPQRSRSDGNGGGWSRATTKSDSQAKRDTDKPKKFGLVVELPAHTSKELLTTIKNVFQRYPGLTPVFLRLKKDDQMVQEIETKSLVDLARPIESDLGILLGRSAISLRELD